MDHHRPNTAFPRSQVSIKTAATVSLTVLGVAFGAWLLARGRLTLAVFAASTLVAVAIDHAVLLLEKRHVPRGVAILLVLVALLAFVGGLGLLVIPEAVAQVRDLVEQGPALLQRLRSSPVWEAIGGRLGLDQLFEGGAAPILPGRAVETSITAVRGVFTWGIVIFTFVFSVVMMLIFGRQLIASALDETLPARRPRYERVLRKMYQSVGGYILGLSLLGLAHATTTTVVLGLLGVPFFIPLGILSGFGSFIPFVGAITVGALMTLIGIASGGVWLGLSILGYYVVYQQVENHLFAPLVYERTIRINPLTTLFAVVFLGELAGIVGAVLAIPALAVFQIILREVLNLRRELLQNHGGGSDEGPPSPGGPQRAGTS